MKLLRLVLRLVFLGFLAGVWLLAGVYLYLSPNLPDVETLRDVKLQTPMRVYTQEGDLIGQFGEQKRTPLAYKDIPPQFVHALMAAEDDGFFEHRGIDVMGLARAVSELVLTGQKGSGGSTLTMQVIRLSRKGQRRTLKEKVIEMFLALRLEAQASKSEVLSLYAGHAPFGGNVVGLEAASRVTLL